MYLDAGFELNMLNEHAISRFQDYLNYAERYDSLCMQMPDIPLRNVYPLEKYYSKKTLVDTLRPSSTTLESNQLLGGVIFMKNSPSNINFVQRWLDFVVMDNYSLINDELVANEIPEFISHRHDQSVFSILYKEDFRFMITDETDWRPDWNAAGHNYPLWCLRNRTGISKGSMRTPDLLDRIMRARNIRQLYIIRTKLKGWMSSM